MKKSKKTIKEKVEKDMSLVSQQDPLGSYTGTGIFGDEPEQDTNDL